jgi:hypothetical protein
MLPFWVSIGLLSLTQGAIVAIPGAWSLPREWSLRSRLWAAIPPISVIAFVFVARAGEHESTQALTYLALGAVPLLAALSLGGLGRAGRPKLALLVAPLFALAWLDGGGLAGEAAALLLTGLSCVTLGVLLAGVTPARWLAAGVVAMALADTALVVSTLLAQPNDVLNAARPAAGLPRLQRVELGSAVMGYGDLFVAGVLGGLLAAGGEWGSQRRAAVLTALLALSFDLLFFAVDELPATVPVALALVLCALASRRGRRRSPRRGALIPGRLRRAGAPRRQRSTCLPGADRR